jgi:hypothetical protein
MTSGDPEASPTAPRPHAWAAPVDSVDGAVIADATCEAPSADQVHRD